MQASAPSRSTLVCLVTFLLAAVPVFFTACGSGMGSAATDGSSQTNSPVVSSVVPDTGSPAGGMTVVINGSNFTSGTQAPSVSFGGVQAPRVAIVSPLQLSVQVPAHAVGTVNVNVTATNGQSATLTGAFTYTTASVSIKGTSPISGPAAGGTTVTISGSNFKAGASVTFGGLAASSVTFSNSTTLVAVTPAHAAGPASIAVTNPNGQSATLASNFTFHSIDLLWSAPSTSPVAITGYNVYRAGSTAGPFSKLNGGVPLATTSFEDPTVEGNTTYYYEVKSVSSGGKESAPDGPVAATTSP